MITAPQPVADNLYLIPLTPRLTGFEHFISAWLYLGEPSFLVDVGPASTANDLIDSLDELGVKHLDYILLTHIHLDHAGAIGELAAKFSRSPIVCQSAGIPHLIDPERLWSGTKKVLGETALGYGPITPVAAERLIAADAFNESGIRVIASPGHAAHHVSYLLDDLLFAGETGGVRIDLGNSQEYLRPATPPRFFLDTALASLEKLIDAAPEWICYGHFGMGDNACQRLTRQKDQMLFWEQVIDRTMQQHADDAELEEICRQILLTEDPLLSAYDRLPPAVQEREAYFLGNSIRGYLGWLKSKPK